MATGTDQQLLTFAFEGPAASEPAKDSIGVEVVSGGGKTPFGPKRGGVSGARMTSKAPTNARQRTAPKNAM